MGTDNCKSWQRPQLGSFAHPNPFWSKIGLPGISSLSDDEIWNTNTPSSLDPSLWSFVMLTFLWRLWDARNSEIFRNELSTRRTLISRVCNDLVVWRKRLKADHVSSLHDWRGYLLSCNATAHSGLTEWCLIYMIGGESLPSVCSKKKMIFLHASWWGRIRSGQGCMHACMCQDQMALPL
jgi:hypothetical protein